MKGGEGWPENYEESPPIRRAHCHVLLCPSAAEAPSHRLLLLPWALAPSLLWDLPASFILALHNQSNPTQNKCHSAQSFPKLPSPLEYTKGSWHLTPPGHSTSAFSSLCWNHSLLPVMPQTPPAHSLCRAFALAVFFFTPEHRPSSFLELAISHSV